MLQIYENIKRYRKQNGWTQEELAKRAGYCDRSVISKIEAGRVDLPQSSVLKFAKLFGVTPGELMGPVEPYSEELTEEERMILRAYRQLDDSGKDLICAALHVKRDEVLKLSDSQAI